MYINYSMFVCIFVFTLYRLTSACYSVQSYVVVIPIFGYLIFVYDHISSQNHLKSRLSGQHLP